MPTKPPGNPEKALPLWEGILSSYKAKYGPTHPSTQGAMATVGLLLVQTKSIGQSGTPAPRMPGPPREEPARRLVDLQHACPSSAGRLLGQKKYAEAEPLL